MKSKLTLPAAKKRIFAILDLNPGKNRWTIEPREIDELEQIIADCPQIIYEQNEHGYTPAVIAAYKRLPARVFKSIIAVDPEAVLKQKSPFGNTPQYEASRWGVEGVLKVAFFYTAKEDNKQDVARNLVNASHFKENPVSDKALLRIPTKAKIDDLIGKAKTQLSSQTPNAQLANEFAALLCTHLGTLKSEVGNFFPELDHEYQLILKGCATLPQASANPRTSPTITHHAPARHMSLIEFITKHGGNLAFAEKLIDEHYRLPPAIDLCIDTKYLAAKYKNSDLKPFSGAAAYIVKHCLNSIFLRNGNYPQIQKLFGFSPTDSGSLMKCSLFENASVFKLSHLGESTFRAAFSAIQIASIFENTKMTVAFLNAPSKNHYTVMIGNTELGWFIYDPTTNPELIFPHAVYKQEILSAIPNASRNGMDCKLIIKKELGEEFTSKWPSIEKELLSLLASNLPTLDDLLNNPKYREVLIANKISESDFLKITEQAFGYIKSQFTVLHDRDQSTLSL